MTRHRPFVAQLSVAGEHEECDAEPPWCEPPLRPGTDLFRDLTGLRLRLESFSARGRAGRERPVGAPSRGPSRSAAERRCRRRCDGGGRARAGCGVAAAESCDRQRPGGSVRRLGGATGGSSPATGRTGRSGQGTGPRSDLCAGPDQPRGRIGTTLPPGSGRECMEGGGDGEARRSLDDRGPLANRTPRVAEPE